VRGHQPVLSDLSLNAQVPLVHVHRLEVLHVRVHIVAIGGKWDVVVVHANSLKGCEPNHGISAWGRRASPWIREICTRHAHKVPEWRGEVHLGSSEHHRPVPIHPIAGTDGHAAFAFGIPCQSDPRTELIPHGTINVFSARILRVAGKNQTCGSIRKYLAMNVLSK